MDRAATAAAVAAYVGSIAAANWMTSTWGLVPIGFGLAVTAGTFAAGAALVLRDWVDRQAGRIGVLLAILAGTALTYLLAGPALALASGTAFIVSEMVDWGVFARVKRKSLAGAVLLSSVVAAPVDTVLFLWIAGFPVTWQAVLGQFLVKTAMAGIAAAAITAAGERHAVPQRV
jgi:hypothetical protein